MKPLLAGRLARVAATLALVVTSVHVHAVPTKAVVCGDITAVWARGSGVVIGADRGFDSFVSRDLVPRLGTAVELNLYQLGQDGGFGGFQYPALGDFLTLIDARWWLPGNPYGNSVDQGRQELIAYVTDRAAQCPNEAFVLGGYSQGAQVIGEGLAGLDQAVRDRIAYVALFGDPTLDTGNGTPLGGQPISFPVACALGPQPWIRGSAPCWISGGQLGSRIPYVPPDMEHRVGSWCRAFDGVCDGSFADLAPALLPLGDGVHSEYFDEDSDSAVAAREAAVALQVALPAYADTFDISWLQFVAGATGADLAVVFDTTGSMWWAIDDARAQASELAQAWLQSFPNARVGLVEYRDQGDNFVSRVVTDLTDNAGTFEAALDGLVAEGGGDYPEAVLSGLMTALDGMSWRGGATKTAVVIADAPGRDPEPITGYTSQQVAQRALEIDPVAVYAVNLGGPDVGDFLEPISTATAGEVFVLEPGQSLSDALFEVIETVVLNPVATLNGPYLAETGTSIRFRTDGSFDADAELVSYEWDLDGDGTVDLTTTTPSVEYTYPADFQGSAAVRVISSDGGSALATAEVTVDSVGLGDRLPLAPVSAVAAIAGAGEATVTWTALTNDLAEAYEIYLPDGTLVGIQPAGEPDFFVVSGLSFEAPISLEVVAANGFGRSASATTPAIGGASVTIALTTAVARSLPALTCLDGSAPEGPASVDSAGQLWLSVGGNATASSAPVTVDYRLYGVSSDESRTQLHDWLPMEPCDGAFDSADEEFSVHEERTGDNFTWFDVDIRATSGGSSSVASARILIDYTQADQSPPSSQLNGLPSSTRDPSITLAGSASDTPLGQGQLTVEILIRYRASTSAPWGAWTSLVGPGSGPNPWSFTWQYTFSSGNGYYEFYSIATDSAGNRELPPSIADATIRKR